MKRKKEDYFVIAVGIVLVIIIFIIAIITTNNTSTQQDPPVTSQPPSRASTPVPQFDLEQKGPAVNINTDDQKKLLERVTNRQVLSAEDIEAKVKILTLIPSGQQSGILYQTKNIIIDYVSTADLFQVEILTINIQQAKDEANIWFRDQGLSQNAICAYPVMFYLNSTVSNQLREFNIRFSPIGNGC